MDAFLEAAIRTATPLLLAAIGEVIAERAGVINIGLEGCIIAGAFAAFAAGALGPTIGYSSAIAAGCLVGVVMAFMSIHLRRDQIVVGAALTMLGLGVTGALFRAREATAPMMIDTTPNARIPLLADIPVIGPALFDQPMITYAAYLLAIAAWFVLTRTHLGLALKAIGDAPRAAEYAGIDVQRHRIGAVLIACSLGGLAGGALVLAQAGTFAEGMSAGRGFIALAIVALGRWRPGGVVLAAAVFGAAMALQYLVQAQGLAIRYELVLMLPYVLTLLALGAAGREAAPARLGVTDSGR